MKNIALITATLIGPFCLMAEGRSEVEILRSRCKEQERQIVQLEKEIDSLHSLLKREQKRPNATGSTSATPPKQETRTENRYHTVVKGDTVSKIARRHKVSVSSIVRANRLRNASQIAIGQKLTIPTQKVAAQPTAKPEVAQKATTTEKPVVKADRTPVSTSTYTVKSGDTFYSIARRNGITIKALQAANPSVRANRLRIGQKLHLNASSNAQVAKGKVENNQPAPRKAEIVKDQPKTNKTQTATAKKKPAPVAETPVSNKPKQTVRAVMVERQMTFGEFCKQHGTTVEQVNELNGHALTKSQLLAKGSELYVHSSRQH